MATLDEARHYLLRIRQQVSRPLGFYELHYQHWADLAAHLAQATLLQLRPETVPADQWDLAVQRAVQTVTGELVAGADIVGARLWMLRMIEPGGANATPYPTEVPFESIVEWVAAGRGGEAGGKHLRDAPGEIDYEKSDRQIAWRVFHAMRLEKSPGLTAAVKDWAEATGDPQVLKAIDNVQVAWETFFSVQCVADFIQWLEMIIAE